MTWILGFLGASGLAAGGLGLAAWFMGAGPVLALVRGVLAFLMKLVKYFGDGLFGIAKRPVEMFACGVLCIATLVVGLWLALGWTKHVREQARGTVANIEAAYTREDDADKAMAAAAVQARAAAEAAERDRQESKALPTLALMGSIDPPAVVDPTLGGVRNPESARAPRRVRHQEPTLLDCIQAAFGRPVKGC